MIFVAPWPGYRKILSAAVAIQIAGNIWILTTQQWKKICYLPRLGGPEGN